MATNRKTIRLLLLSAVPFGAAFVMGSAPKEQAPATPLATVQALYAAFEKGDIKAIDALIAPDATWTYYGPTDTLPFAGTRKGPAGVADFFAVVDKTLEGSIASQREMLVSGDTVIAPGWEESTVKATGGHYKVPLVHIFKVSNGKITRFEEYIDSGTVVDAFTPANPARGQAYYSTCTGCHGVVGEGRPEMHAPRLAGTDKAYLIRQLRNFRAGVRGKTDDIYGYMMVGRANALPGDRAVRDVVSYIASLPKSPQVPVSPSSSLVTAGAKVFETCAACHGAKGEGNAEVQAPSLRGLSAQYVLAQLTNFRAGRRGADPKDVEGQQMKAALEGVPATDDPAVAAFVATLHD